VGFLVLSTFAVLVSTSTSVSGDPGIEDRMEPVIIQGSDISNFLGSAIDELWVYSYISGDWIQIPFQIDERNDANGSYFYDSEDGFLDSNDEIVFMPFDSGYEAPGANRVPNTESERYKINITDPIDSSKRYVYIYSSSIITKTFGDDYVDYNQIPGSIDAMDYSIGFNGSSPGVIDRLSVSTQAGGDASDILDRFKFRFQKTVEVFPEQYNEDNFTYKEIGVKDGPVRVILGMERTLVTDDFNIKVDDTIMAYSSLFRTNQTMSSNTSTDWVEVTVDFLSASTPLTYYDSNTNQLTMDGSPETPGITDAPEWNEVTGSFGTVVTVGNYSQIGVTPSLSYIDDLSVPDAPEFEMGVYGKHGLSIPNPSVGYQVDYSYYMLSSNQGNIGEYHFNSSQMPIMVDPVLEIIDPSAPPDITDAQSTPDTQEVGGMVNITVQVKDNLNEVLSVHVLIMDPSGSEVGNYSMTYHLSSDKYFFQQIFTGVGTYDYTIWAVDYNDNWNSQSGEFNFEDTIIPEISDITSLPAQQGVGENVNISSVITDFVSVSGAWVMIEDPHGEQVGNFSMEYHSDDHRYFYNDGYFDVGTYSFTIFSNDTSNNWNSSQGQFEILDTLSPNADAGLSAAINTGTIVQFNGSGSTDNVGIVNYSWTFFDINQVTLNGPTPSYRFENTGDFGIILNATDEMGNWDVDFVWVNVTEIVTTGSISGIVTDSDGSPIAVATVTIVGTAFSTTTDGIGSYLIEDVPAGNYDIMVIKDNYKDKEITGVLVIAGQTTSNVEVSMSKEQTTSSDDSSGLVWILLVIIIVVIVLVVFLIARPKKETEIVEEVIEELNFLCPECGTLVNYDMKSCPGCGVAFGEGEEVEEEPKESPADIYMCPSCGSFVSSQASTCEKCGFVFDEDSQPEKKTDEEEVKIPEGFLGGSKTGSEDENKGAKKEYHGVNIPSEISDRVAKQVEDLINENGFELEETELELEVELEGDLTSEEKKKETKEILELFRNEFNSEDSGKDHDTLSKEIDTILGNSQKSKDEDDVEITDEDEE
jgi:hypothetical protein